MSPLEFACLTVMTTVTSFFVGFTHAWRAFPLVIDALAGR